MGCISSSCCSSLCCCSVCIASIPEKTARQLSSAALSKIAPQPLDLILFKGSNVVSKAISTVTTATLGSSHAFSHVGVLVNTSVLPIANGVPGRWYIWESILSGPCYDNVPDVQTGSWFFGSQVRDFDLVLYQAMKAGDSVYWCPLIDNPLQVSSRLPDTPMDSVVKFVRSHEKLISAYTKLHHKKYDYNPCHCMRAVGSGCCLKTYSCICSDCCRDTTTRSDKKSSANRVFCSELVASIFIELGVLPSTLDPETVAPSELVFKGNGDQSAVVGDFKRLQLLV